MRSRLGSRSSLIPRSLTLGSLSLGTVNLALLSLYFFPVWGRGAFRALTSPYNGLEDRVHATAAIYFRQLFDLGSGGLVMMSHVLAGVKLVIAAAFVAYLIEFARALAVRREPDRETVDVVLILATIGILLHAVPAFASGDAAMVRLYAAQLLLIAGAITVIVIERHVTPAPKPASRVATVATEREALQLGLPLGVLMADPPPDRAAAALARIPEARLRSH
jgi:hypothetical protein